MRLRSVIIVLISAVFLSACGGSEQGVSSSGSDLSKKFRWKMVTTWPANFPVFQEGAEKFADEVRLMSNGRLDIQVFAGVN